MANYKDIISGAFGKAVSKVKEVADNTNVRELYEQGTDKVKSYGRIAKLNIELSGHNEELKRMYTEIGKQYYEQAKGCPEGFFASLFAQVDALLEEVNAKEAEIAALKEGCCPNCGIDVEIVEDECCCEGECCCDSECCCEKTFREKLDDFVVNVCDKTECVCEILEEKLESVCDKVEAKIEEKLGE